MLKRLIENNVTCVFVYGGGGVCVCVCNDYNLKGKNVDD